MMEYKMSELEKIINSVMQNFRQTHSDFCKETARQYRLNMILHLLVGFMFFNIGFFSLLFLKELWCLAPMISGIGFYVLGFFWGKDSEHYDNLRSD